jgi:phage baseplate assembly protein W
MAAVIFNKGTIQVEGKSFGFPFAVNTAGGIAASGGDEAIRGKIIQVLFTAPGERVNLPEFGCGLFNLVFEPNNPILAAAMEFTVGAALTRWLRDDLVVDGVNVETAEATVIIEIAYTKRQDLAKQAVRIHFK